MENKAVTQQAPLIKTPCIDAQAQAGIVLDRRELLDFIQWMQSKLSEIYYVHENETNSLALIKPIVNNQSLFDHLDSVKSDRQSRIQEIKVGLIKFNERIINEKSYLKSKAN